MCCSKPLDTLQVNTYIFPAMAKKKTKKPVIRQLVFAKENYQIFLGGLFLIILGYILMAVGDTYSALSLTISPLILLVAYLVIIPAAIVYRKNSSDTQSE